MSNTVRELRPEASFCLQFFTGATVIGAAALAGSIIPDSIGASDGAVYGTFAVLLGKPIQVLFHRALQPDVPTTCSKMIASTLSFFSASAGSWGITNAIRQTRNVFTYSDSLGLSALTGTLTAVFLSPCIYCYVKASRESRPENVISLIPQDNDEDLPARLKN